VDRGILPQIRSFDWGDLYCAYDANYDTKTNYHTYSIAIAASPTIDKISKLIHQSNFPGNPEKLSFKQLRYERQVDRSIDFLNNLSDVPLLTLSLSVDSVSWASMKKYLQPIWLEIFPEISLPIDVKKGRQLLLITEMLLGLIEISQAKYERINILLDNDDFTDNQELLTITKSLIGNNICTELNIAQERISIAAKREFHELREYVALLQVPDLVAGMLGQVLLADAKSPAHKVAALEETVIASRNNMANLHLTGIIEHNHLKTIVALHSWQSSD